ncbi:pilus assembly protein PilA [Vibrio vulnificus]|nr:pilus assembly protein PilA [Vibrio vulnificus]
MLLIDLWLSDEGLSVVEYVVGAAFLIAAIGLFFVGYQEIMSDKASSIIQSF